MIFLLSFCQVMSAKLIRSRKSNYQFFSKWQVRVKNVRWKFRRFRMSENKFCFLWSIKNMEFLRLKDEKVFRHENFSTSLELRATNYELLLIKFHRRFQFPKFYKSVFLHRLIASMEKVRKCSKIIVWKFNGNFRCSLSFFTWTWIKSN